MRPDLYRECPSPHPQRECPRCRTQEDVRCYRGGELKAVSRCPECRSVLASEVLWLEMRAWCRTNYGLLRDAIRAGNKWFMGLDDVEEVMSACLGDVVRLAVTHDPTVAKFGTVVFGMIRKAARRYPRLMRTMDPDVLNRRAG